MYEVTLSLRVNIYLGVLAAGNGFHLLLKSCQYVTQSHLKCKKYTKPGTI